eukprot:g1043.t1
MSVRSFTSLIVRSAAVLAAVAADGGAGGRIMVGAVDVVEKGAAAADMKIAKKKLSREQFVDVFMGVADGFGLDLVEACIKDDVAFEQNIKSAVAEFEKKTEDGMKQALSYLATAFKSDLPSAIKECKGTYDQVQSVLKSIGSFASPTTFAYHIGKDLLVNGVDILENMRAAVAGWKTQDYHLFGLSVGHALKDVLIGMGSIYSLFDPATGVALLQGIVEGLGASVDATCITSSEKMVSEMQKIMIALEKGTKMGIAEAMMLLSVLLKKTLPEVEASCAETEGQLDDILKALEQYKTATALIEHLGADLVANSEGIAEDSKAAIMKGPGHGKYPTGTQANYERAGYHLGHALKLILIGKDGKFGAQGAAEMKKQQDDVYV